MSKECGVDPDAPLQEIELSEGEEEDPRGDLDLVGHCMAVMNPIPGNEENKILWTHRGVRIGTTRER